ncbi:MAG: zinc ribbon domain-containing protein [Acidobacteria bacterium]|nr:zinc ribbon domain-containing protein [Acidobacteriota bacterium]
MARKSGDKPRSAGRPAVANQPAVPAIQAADDAGGIRAWHLVMLATVIAVAASVFVTRGSSTTNMVSVAAAVATVALAAAGIYRTLAPLGAPDLGEQTEMVGGRTRAALEREKMLVLRSIKEVEFDRAMRKISEADYQEMVGRLRSRAAGLLRQLDGGGMGYRELIERDLATRVGASPAKAAASPAPPKPRPGCCPACRTENDADARFCKSCGAQIGGAA